MADFCRQCSIETWGRDFGELAGLCTEANNDQGLFAVALCEGCGAIQVDHGGNCVSSDCAVNHTTRTPREKNATS